MNLSLSVCRVFQHVVTVTLNRIVTRMVLDGIIAFHTIVECLVPLVPLLTSSSSCGVKNAFWNFNASTITLYSLVNVIFTHTSSKRSFTFRCVDKSVVSMCSSYLSHDRY
jgi:hypothetical protein